MSPVDAAVASSAGPIPNLAVRHDDWRFNFSPGTGKIEVFRANRPDLSHLTLSWGTKSGEFDIHLTRGHEQAMAGGPPKQWDPIIKITRADLEQLSRRLNRIVERTVVPRVLAAYKKYRPGWLGRRGYVVVFVEGDEMLAWLRRAAPRVRGKYELRPEQLDDPTNYPAGLVDSIYYPSILNEIQGVGSEIPVSAVRARRRRASPRDTIVLRYTLGPDGTIGWWGMKHSAIDQLHQAFGMVFGELATSLLGPDHARKLDSILVGLGVEDGRRREIVQTLTTVISQYKASVAVITERVDG